MSIKQMARVWDESAATGPALLVILALADWADEHGRSYPSMPVLARKSRLKDRAVQYAVGRLVALGELKVDRKAGPHGTNVYRLLGAGGGGARHAPPVVHAMHRGGAPPCTRVVHRHAPPVVHGHAPNTSVDPSVDPSERETEATNGDITRLLSLSFPSGSPPEKAEAAVIDRAAAAIRRGATWPLLAWAVVSDKPDLAEEPWKRITQAGRDAADLVKRARERFAELHPPFTGRTLADLAAYRPTTGEFPRGHPVRTLAAEVRAWRRLVTEWPPERK